MIHLILILIIGTMLAFISQYNVQPTTVNLGFTIISDIPLFYVMVGSLLTGLILSYMFQLLSGISYSLALRGKRKEIKSSKEENLGLAKRVHQLEIEKERLKHAKSEPSDTRAL